MVVGAPFWKFAPAAITRREWCMAWSLSLAEQLLQLPGWLPKRLFGYVSGNRGGRTDWTAYQPPPSYRGLIRRRPALVENQSTRRAASTSQPSRARPLSRKHALSRQSVWVNSLKERPLASLHTFVIPATPNSSPTWRDSITPSA